MDSTPKRRFVRIKVRLPAVLDHRRPVMIRSLSLGGCLAESTEPLAVNEPAAFTFRIEKENFDLVVVPLDSIGDRQQAFRFKFNSARQMSTLARLLQQLLGRPLAKRPARLNLSLPASIDREPATLTNLSEGGCSLSTTAPHYSGEMVEVEIALEGERIQLAAEIKWQNEEDIGLEFILPDPAQIMTIAEFIAKHTQGVAPVPSRR